MPTKREREEALELMRQRQEEDFDIVEVVAEQLELPLEPRTPEGSRRPAEPRENLTPRTS